MTAQFARAPYAGRPPVLPNNPQAALLIDFDNVTMGIRSDLGNELRQTLGEIREVLRSALGPHVPPSLHPSSPARALPAGSTVTVEPGGQVELASPPLAPFGALVRTFAADAGHLPPRLEAPGIERLTGSGVYYGAAPAEAAEVEGEDVVGYNYVDRWHERRELFAEEDRVAHPDWKMVGTESASAGNALGDAYSEPAADVRGLYAWRHDHGGQTGIGAGAPGGAGRRRPAAGGPRGLPVGAGPDRRRGPPHRADRR